MARVLGLKQHRTWEDWAGIGLGVLIGLAPWIADQSLDRGILFISVALGLLIMTAAQFELVGLNRWGEIVELICGLALVALPVLAGYADAGSLRFWHFALGGGVALLAALELWQDWRLSDDELARQRQ